MVEIDEKQAFSIISKAKDTGNVKIGANEVTKSLERGQSQLVVTATDVSPEEIVAHFPGLCNEMDVLYLNSGTKAELGTLVGIKSTTALGVVDAGSAKKELDNLIKSMKEEKQKEGTDVSSESQESSSEEVDSSQENSEENKSN